jgi:predicted MFS family arabinose efflux permease
VSRHLKNSADDRIPSAAAITLSVAGVATFLLMPQFVEAAVADLRFTEQQIGILSSAVMIGYTLAALASGLWIRRSSWRLASAAALVGMLFANSASMVIHGFAPFLVLQGIASFCGGSLYSLSLTVLSDSHRPDRYFAYSVGAQTIYQVLGLLAGPFLIARGMSAMLLQFCALCVAGLLLVPFVPSHGRFQHDAPIDGHQRNGRLVSGPVLLGLAGCFLFFVNVGAYWTYIERIGTGAGLGLSPISNGLAFSTAASMAGVVLAAWLGHRRGFFLPIAASAFAVLLSMVLLTGNLKMAAYIVSAVIYGIAWNVSLTYQYSTVNLVDRSRLAVALAPAFHNAGGAVGPALAALVVTESDHTGVLWLVSVSVVASLLCFWMALRLHSRETQTAARAFA